MKMKYVLNIWIIFLSVYFLSCSAKEEPRKIKLSDETVITRTDNQLTTTIHLEPTERRSIAVLFFENLTGDKNLEWLQKGLTEMLIRALSQSSYLSVLSTDRLVELIEQFDKTNANQKIDLDLAAIVAKRANVEALLTGNISKDGNSLKINVKVHEPNKGEILREESVEGAGLENIFSMVDQLTTKIKQDLHLTLGEEELIKGIADITTHSLDAWRHYTLGLDLMNKFLNADAIPHFESAISEDSTFVMAYLRLISAYGAEKREDEVMEIYKKLEPLKEFATEEENYRIKRIEAGMKSDIRTMIDIFHQWLQKYPDDAEANYELGSLYYGVHNYTESISYLQKALKVDPSLKLAMNQLGYSYARIGDFDQAIKTLDQYKKIAPNEPNPYDSMGEVYLMMGNFEQAEKHFKEAKKINQNFNVTLTHLANLYIDKGEFKKAIKTFEHYLKTIDDGMRKGSIYGIIGSIYAKLENYEQAKQYYLTAIENNKMLYWTTKALSDVYLQQQDSLRARSVLVDNYNKIKQELSDDELNQTLFYTLLTYSMMDGIQVDSTIAVLQKILQTSDNPTLNLRIKFSLSLLLIKNGRHDELNKLWPEEEPDANIIHVFRDVRDLSYGNLWQGYSVFNRFYYNYFEKGVSDYHKMISSAKKEEAKLFERGFRLLLSDLYFHNGNFQQANEQLSLVGMAEENKWKIIGPFDNKNGFEKNFPPEKEIKLNKVYHDKNQDITWRTHQDDFKDGFINLKQMITNSDWSVAYGFIYVESPDNRYAQFRIGSNEAVKVWLNKKEVWRFNGVRYAVLDDNIVNVQLLKGRNAVLIKVCNRTLDWGFYFRITDSQGNVIPDIKFVSA